MKPERFRNGYDFAQGHELGLSLDETHVHLKDLEFPGFRDQLERVFMEMQAEVWSPNGEARSLIAEKGLSHTSMSVGDAIVYDNKVYIVGISGFKPNLRLTSVLRNG
jgi:hypothetical protein